MPRKPSRKTLKKQLISIAGKLALNRDNYICQKCGKKVSGSSAHPSHVIPKSKGDVYKWDVKNIKCLCFHCHIQWWHLNPTESGEWFRKKYPKRYHYLQNLKPRAYKMWELQEQLQKLKEEYAKTKL